MAEKAKTTKGIFDKDTEKKLGQIADKAVQLKNPIAEAVDGPVFTASIRALDNLVLDKLPEKIKNEIRGYIPEIVKAL